MVLAVAVAPAREPRADDHQLPTSGATTRATVSSQQSASHGLREGNDPAAVHGDELCDESTKAAASALLGERSKGRSC